MKISAIHKAIADNYIANGYSNKTEAYLSVKPLVKRTTAKVKACNIFKRSEVDSYLEEQQSKVSVAAIASKEALILQAHRLGVKAEEQDKLNTALSSVDTKAKLNNIYDRDVDNPADYGKLLQSITISGDVNIYKGEDKTIDITPGN